MTHPKKMLGVIQAHMIVKLVVRSTLQISAALTAKKTCAKLQLSFILATRQVAIIKLFPLRLEANPQLTSVSFICQKHNDKFRFFDEKCGHAVCRECVTLENLGHLCLPLAEGALEYGKEVKDFIKKTNVETGLAAERFELEIAQEKGAGDTHGFLEEACCMLGLQVKICFIWVNLVIYCQS